MSEASPNLMTVDEFLAWAEVRAQRTVEDAIARAGLPCEAMGDGMTVRVDARTAYAPDALVYCGEPLPPDAILVPAPVIVVQVLSPSTGFFDRHGKLLGYFAVPSIHHCLIVDIDRRMVIHHARDGGEIRTRLFPSGPLRLDPPGLDLALDDLSAPLRPDAARRGPYPALSAAAFA